MTNDDRIHTHIQSNYTDMFTNGATNNRGRHISQSDDGVLDEPELDSPSQP